MYFVHDQTRSERYDLNNVAQNKDSVLKTKFYGLQHGRQRTIISVTRFYPPFTQTIEGNIEGNSFSIACKWTTETNENPDVRAESAFFYPPPPFFQVKKRYCVDGEPIRKIDGTDSWRVSLRRTSL